MKKLKVTSRDLWEFNAWIKGKVLEPRLLKEFKSIDEYSEYMERESQKQFSIDDNVLLNPESTNPNKPASTVGSAKLMDFITLDGSAEVSDLNYSSLLGTMLMSISFSQLYAISTVGKYNPEIFKSYTTEASNSIAKLAEHIIAYGEVKTFTNLIKPGSEPKSYFTDLVSICTKAKVQLFNSSSMENSSYAAQVDEVINLISSVLYKLKTALIDNSDIAPANKQFSASFNSKTSKLSPEVGGQVLYLTSIIGESGDISKLQFLRGLDNYHGIDRVEQWALANPKLIKGDELKRAIKMVSHTNTITYMGKLARYISEFINTEDSMVLNNIDDMIQRSKGKNISSAFVDAPEFDIEDAEGIAWIYEWYNEYHKHIKLKDLVNIEHKLKKLVR